MNKPNDGYPPLRVCRWPEDGAWPVVAENLLIAAVNSEKTPNRAAARRLVRHAIADILALHLSCPPADIRLISTPGQALRLDLAGTAIGLSVSHAPGLSLLAIYLTGPVGIDLMPSVSTPDWLKEIPRVAQDYLGPQVAAQLAALPLDEQATSFAAAWTRLEASLKCRGIGLDEWRTAPQDDLRRCPSFSLRLPAGLIGSLALPAPKSASQNP